MSEEKKCSKCENIYPNTLDFFHKNNNAKNGLDSCCKICRNAKHVEYRQKNKDRIKQYDLKRKAQFKDKIGIVSVALHNYIRRKKPKQEYCTICNKKKKLQLASIGHAYTRDPNDYIWLCQSCHYLFDKCMEVIII